MVASHHFRIIRQAHCSTVCFAHGIFGGHLLGMFDGHFDWFSILISRNWRSHQARSFTFDITWRTQNRVAHKVCKICPYWGTLNYFHFGRGFFFGCFVWQFTSTIWHFDCTELRSRQARSLTFDNCRQFNLTELASSLFDCMFRTQHF